MKIVALGDTHGRSIWKKIVDKEMDADKIVFIGDYFDTKENITAQQQLKNFEDIITIKELYPDKIELLFGNHDFHYMRGMAEINELYSGFQELHCFDIQDKIHEALDKNLFSMCHIYDKYLFSHAGISNTWLKSTGYQGKIENELIQNYINDLFRFKPLSFRFTPGNQFDMYGTGEDISQTPIWIRPKSLLQDGLNPYIFVVGHTMQEQMTNIANKIYLIDTLGTSEEYFVLEDGKITFQTIK